MTTVIRIVKNIAITFAGFAIIALLFLGVINLITYLRQNETPAQAAEVSTTTKSGEEPVAKSSDEAKTEDEFSDFGKMIKIDLSDELLKDLYEEYSREFDDISFPNRNEERTTAPAEVGWHKKGEDRMYDAVADPFDVVETGKTLYSKDDIAEMKAELYEAIMRNPVMGDMIGQWLDDIDTENVNPWVDVFLGEYKSYGPNNFVVKYENKGDTVYVTEEYRGYAKRILCFLDRCTEQGVKTIATSDFWYLNDAMEPKDVRTVRNEDKKYVDTYPALIFVAEVKDGSAKVRFGFNIYDKRLEIFEARVPRPKVTPAPTKIVQKKYNSQPPSKNPDPDPDPDPTPTPSKKIPCDPQEDPVHKDNADVGGGQNQPGDGPGPEQPKDPETDQSGGHKDPATVTPTSPVPSPQPGEPIAVDENPIDYEVDPVPTEPTTGNDGAVDIGSEPPGEEFDEPPIG